MTPDSVITRNRTLPSRVLFLASENEDASPMFFFFQAEDGIRGGTVTGVQTCALPIYVLGGEMITDVGPRPGDRGDPGDDGDDEGGVDEHEQTVTEAHPAAHAAGCVAAEQ